MKKIFMIILIFLFLMSSVAFSRVTNKIITEKIIYLDPGHGGQDGGTTYYGIMEKEITLSFSFVLKEVLENAGYKVFLIRNGDYDLAGDNSNNRKRDDILKRVDLINNSRCDLYLSIHVNSYPGGKERGAQVFYNKNNEDSERLSKFIQEAIKNEINNTNREALGIKNKYLIDNTKKVGSLIEIGFLSNREECMLLIDKSYQRALSCAILLGIEEYYKVNI